MNENIEKIKLLTRGLYDEFKLLKIWFRLVLLKYVVRLLLKSVQALDCQDRYNLMIIFSMRNYNNPS